jgi:hypothetical protein
LRPLVLQCLDICAAKYKEDNNMTHSKSGERVITEREYEAIREAIEKVAEASGDLSEGLKTLEKVFRNCCIHKAGGGNPRRDKRLSLLRKRAS